MKKSVSIIGVPMWLGQTRYGTNLGPSAIRSVGVIERLQALNDDVIDTGDIVIGLQGKLRKNEENIKNVKKVAKACEKLAEVVANNVAQNRFPLILGGDHSISIGSIAGLAKHYKNLGVIWYDAHADMNTPLTSPSGNIHGMPLAVSMGLGHSALTKIGSPNAKIKSENIVLIGARDIDEGEKILIREKNIKVYSAKDVKRLGITQVINETVEYLAARCDGIHLSFDLDGIDPTYAPGVGTPVGDGINFSDSMLAMNLLAQAKAITSAEFVEVNPILDDDQTTSFITASLISALFGDTNISVEPSKMYRRTQHKVIYSARI